LGKSAQNYELFFIPIGALSESAFVLEFAFLPYLSLLYLLLLFAATH